MAENLQSMNDEVQYRLLFENNPNPMWVFDQETLFILAVNDTAVQRYGYSREEFLSMTIKDIRPPENIPNLMNNLTKDNILPGICFAGEWRHCKKDGTIVDVEITRSPILFSGRRAVLILLHDITERKRVERHLNLQYAIGQILAESDVTNEAIPKILQTTCESLGWDFGEIWIIDQQTNALRCMEIWHDPSLEIPEFKAVTRQITFSQGIGLPGRIWACAKPVWITDVVHDTNFPRAPIAAKEGLHGAFGFPILSGNEILGVIVFLNRRIQQPDEDLLKIMVAIGGQVGQFVKRKEAEKALKRRIDFEKAVSSISARFAILSDFDNAVSSSLADAGRLVGVGRAYLFQFRENGNIIDNTHEWCDKGVTPEIQHLQNLPTAIFPWWMNILHTGKSIRIPDISKMPPEAAAEKKILEKQGIKSLLALPVYAEKELVGFIGFDNVVTTGEWQEEDIDLLHIMAEIVGTAIARKQSEAVIKHMAYHDAITNLPNRILFQDRLQMALHYASRNEQIMAVVFLDLDYFKAVNDSLGHHVGDLLLRAVAERLTCCVRESDTVARAGGDEFMIILTDLVHEQDVAIIARKILNSFCKSFQFGKHQISSSASLGISLYPHDADNSENLIKLADIAMYLSKEQGKNTYRFYNPELNTHVKQNS